MFTTNNTILLKHTENLPPIYCIQRKGNKVVPTETDMIQANKGSFGDAIGPITNVITSQICLQARFPKDSEEYKVLDYRILCGQLFQQNSIDKAKGIIAKPMPKHWYDNSYNRIEETDTPEEISKKEFNQRICADKKPYFFIYNYPTLMKEYKDYIKTSDAVSRSRFNIPLEELLSSQELTEEQAEFLKFYKEFYPVNAETCVVNELCWEIEKTLADVKESKVPFDSSILKSDATYTNKDKVLIERIYDKFNKQMNRSCTTKTDAFSASYNKAFKIECAEYVSDPEKLCNILVDLGYNSQKGKSSFSKITEKFTEKKEDIILACDDLWFRYDKELPDVVKGLSFSLKRGEFFALLGGNGTGKSTTLSLLSRLRKPYRGKVLLEGKDIRRYSDKELFRNFLGVLPQNPQSLFVKKSVELELFEMVGGVKEKKDEEYQLAMDKKDAVEGIIKVTHLEELLHRHPYDLSGGEQQRLALAKILLLRPKLLLMDEPTKGLDSYFKKEFAGILALLKEQGVTVFMISHDIEFCASYADRCGLFFDGNIVACGTPGEFFAGNNFYTTAANRMARRYFPMAVTGEDVVKCLKKGV